MEENQNPNDEQHNHSLDDAQASSPMPSGRTPKIRTCPYCKQKYEVKSPWEALWRWPTLQEWLILFMMAMMVFAAWAYKHDIQVCRDFIANRTGVFVTGSLMPNYTAQIPDVNNIHLNDTTVNVTGTPGTGGSNLSNST